jgi:hypothetical protein
MVTGEVQRTLKAHRTWEDGSFDTLFLLVEVNFAG